MNQVEILQCAKCETQFLPKIENGLVIIPERCPNRKCRALRWDSKEDMRKYNQIKNKTNPAINKIKCPKCDSKNIKLIQSFVILKKYIRKLQCNDCKEEFKA